MLQSIDISKGSNLTIDGQEMPQAGYATDWRNLLKSDAGADVDRPALSAFASIAADPVEGLFYFKLVDKVIAVTSNLGTPSGGRRVWSIDEAGIVTNITGTTLDGTNRPVFDNDGTYAAIAGGNIPLQWSGGGTTTALAGSPANCTHVSYLDGYWINHLIDDQEFRWAGPTAVARATWSSANFFQAEGLPDNIKAQGVLQRELYAFGRDSTEVYQNFGSTSTPFQRTFFLESGIIAPYSLIKANYTFHWLDQERNFVSMEGRTPVIKSDDVTKVIKNFGTVEDCIASHIKIGPHYLIVWTFPTEERSFCYDIKRGAWGEWDGYVNGLSDRLDINAHCYVPEWNRHLVGSAINGKIYTLSLDNKTDGANPLRRVREMQYDWGTNNRKTSSYYLLHFKRGVATASVTDPKVMVSWNDDNKGWSEEKIISLGELGSKTDALRVKCGGIYRRRRLRVTMTDACEFVLTKIEEEVSGGAS